MTYLSVMLENYFIRTLCQMFLGLLFDRSSEKFNTWIKLKIYSSVAISYIAQTWKWKELLGPAFKFMQALAKIKVLKNQFLLDRNQKHILIP